MKVVEIGCKEKFEVAFEDCKNNWAMYRSKDSIMMSRYKNDDENHVSIFYDGDTGVVNLTQCLWTKVDSEVINEL